MHCAGCAPPGSAAAARAERWSSTSAEQHCCRSAQEIFDGIRADGRQASGSRASTACSTTLAELRLVQRVDIGDGVARYEPAHRRRRAPSPPPRLRRLRQGRAVLRTTRSSGRSSTSQAASALTSTGTRSCCTALAATVASDELRRLDAEEPAGSRTNEGRPGRPSECSRCGGYSIRVSILNIGRYIATMITPTIIPTPIIMIGSMIAVSAATAASTSSS